MGLSARSRTRELKPKPSSLSRGDRGFESASLHRRVACELDITGSAIDVRSRLKLAAFIDDSENDVLSYLDFASAIVSAPRCWMHLHGLPVEAKATRAEDDDVKETPGHH